MMHRNSDVSELLKGDLTVLLGRHVGDVSNGSYYPGYRMLMNMVARSKNLEEITYTGVREDVLELARDILIKPWKDLSKTKHDDDTVRKPIKVYVETMWYRISQNGCGRVDSGVVPLPRTLLFDSSR